MSGGDWVSWGSRSWVAASSSISASSSGRSSSSTVWSPFGWLAAFSLISSPEGFVEGCGKLFFYLGACLGNHGWWVILLGISFGPRGGRCWEALLGNGGAISYLIVEGLLIGVVNILLGGSFFSFVGLRGGCARRWLVAVVGVKPGALFS